MCVYFKLVSVCHQTVVIDRSGRDCVAFMDPAIYCHRIYTQHNRWCIKKNEKIVEAAKVFQQYTSRIFKWQNSKKCTIFFPYHNIAQLTASSPTLKNFERILLIIIWSDLLSWRNWIDISSIEFWKGCRKWDINDFLLQIGQYWWHDPRAPYSIPKPRKM